MRFLADMGVSNRVVTWLDEQGHETTHLPNGAIFEKAVAEERIVLTCDLDFSEIAALTGDSLTSVISFRLRNTRPAFAIQRLEAVLTASIASLEAGAVISVEDARHRVRKLPVGRDWLGGVVPSRPDGRGERI